MDDDSLAQVERSGKTSISSADRIQALRQEISRSRAHLKADQAARSELKELEEEYSRGKDDYLEAMGIIEERLTEFNQEINDAKEKLEKGDFAIDTNRRRIEEAEHEIHELEGGATLVIQVPVVHKSKIEQPKARKEHKKQKLGHLTAEAELPFHDSHPGVIAAQSSRHMVSATHHHGPRTSHSSHTVVVDDYGYPYEHGNGAEYIEVLPSNHVSYINTHKPKTVPRAHGRTHVVEHHHQPHFATHPTHHTVQHHRYAHHHSPVVTHHQKVVEPQAPRQAQLIYHDKDSGQTTVANHVEPQPPIEHTVTTQSVPGLPTQQVVQSQTPLSPPYMPPMEVSPAAKALAANKLKQVLIVKETSDEERAKIAKEPVSLIQEIVKNKQEEARKILKQKEDEAKKEIDRIVSIKKEEDAKAEKELKSRVLRFSDQNVGKSGNTGVQNQQLQGAINAASSMAKNNADANQIGQMVNSIMSTKPSEGGAQPTVTTVSNSTPSPPTNLNQIDGKSITQAQGQAGTGTDSSAGAVVHVRAKDSQAVKPTKPATVFSSP